MRYGESDREHLRGLRSIATVEIVKGAGSVALAIGVYSLLRQDYDLQAAVFNMLDFLCIDAGRHWAQALTELAGRAMSLNAALVLTVILLYASLRFLEGFGLWFGKVWAEWFGAISGAIFLPIEIYEIIRRSSPMRWLFFLVNVAIVAYLVSIIYRKRLHRKRGPQPQPPAD